MSASQSFTDRDDRPSAFQYADNEERLTALHRYQILDTDPEPAFDRVSRLAAHLFDAPMALVNFLTDERQWFKSRIGVDEEETGLDASFCVYTVEKGDVLVVEDLSEDERFADNPYVTEHDLRFYAGAPLITPDDHRIGTVCVLDTEPRSPSAETVDRLADLAAMVVDELELRRERTEHAQSREQLAMAVEGCNIGTWNWDVETGEVIFNERWAGMLGYSREELDFHFSTWEELVHPEDLSRAMAIVEDYIAGERDTYAPKIRMRTKSGQWMWIQTIGKVVERDEEGTVTRAAGIHLDIDDRKRAEQALRQAKTRYQTLVENFPDGGVFLLDEDLRYLLAGGKGLAGVGLSSKDFEGASPHDLFPLDVAEEKISYLRRALDGETHTFDQAYEGRHYRLQTLPVRSEDGEIASAMVVSQDVTERKQSRRRLERYRDYTGRLINAVDDLFFALDEEAQFQRWNDRIPEVTGYSDEEIGSMTAFDLVPESERKRVERRISEALAEGGGQIEVPLLRKDGTTVPYEFAGSLVQTPEGGSQIVGIGRDIAARKERERRLRQAETFFQHAQDALFLVDVEGEEGAPAFSIRRINPSHETQFGLPEEEVRGKSPREILDEEEARHAEAMYRRCVNRREPLEYEEQVSLDETTRHWQTRIAPVVVEGTVRWIVGSSRDITERKRRKEVLERQNDLFTKAQDIASVGAWEYDLQSEEVNWTEQTYRLYDLSPDAEMTPDTAIAFYHPEDQSTIREAFTEAVEKGEPYDLELRLITADDEHRWVRTRGEPQEEDGEIVRVRGTIQDVTERVRRREQLETAKEAAEEADRIKSALLSNMNHEFRTPLTSIITFSDLIRENPEIADRFVDRILSGGKRLLYTLNTVMDFAELEGSGPSVTPKPFHPRDVAHSVVSDFREEARRKGIELSIAIPERMGTVTLDEHLVERILTHLVHNAIKFTDEGEVTISAQAGDTVELRVKDTGVGIDPDVSSQVFEEFMQASSGYDRTHEGNGLGLTVVKRHVEAMGGTIDIESAPGDGTQVTVRLPIRDDAGP